MIEVVITMALLIILISGRLLRGRLMKENNKEHIHCGTPKCCGKCESAKKTVKKDENIRKDDKKND